MITNLLSRGHPLGWTRVFLRRASIAAAALMSAFVGSSALRADTTPPPTQPPSGYVTTSEMGTGSLLLKTVEPGQYLEAPRLKTDVAITVTGPIARARITQRFENPSDKWVEGIYVFPLPQNAGVDTLRMQIGDRFLEGQVKEREQARQIYERAAAQGYKATLVEQQRPNMFTNSVANIGPHETVVVQIEYQEAVRLDGDKFSLRVPLVVGPRYTPAAEALVADSSSSGVQVVAVHDPVPDRDAVTPPVVNPIFGKINPVTLSVTLKSGVSLAAIESPYHEVDISRTDDKTATVSLKGPVPADRDFVLNWKLAASGEPQASLYRETINGKNYYLAMVVPPVGTTQRRQAREAIFVIDNSGSMGGESIKQAKKALLMALSELKPGDRFNVVRFDDTLTVLFKDAVPADDYNLAVAKSFVNGLEAAGGTEIYPALKAALVDTTPLDTTRLRQVIFLTDGDVSNEDQVLTEIGLSLGRSRLFTVGIGSAPNSFLMEHIASQGRGTFTHIGSEAEVDARMTELFNKLESPVMTDLRVTTNDAKLETWPNPIPDLYAGEPVVLTGATDERTGTLRLEGRMGSKPWAATLDLASAVEGSGVSTLWARSKISAIEDLRYHGTNQGDVDAQVLKVALDFHLVSRLTSLVAVDVTPSRPEHEDMTSQEMPTNLPAGWDFTKVFGEDPAHPMIKASIDPALMTKLASNDKPVVANATDGVELPQTDAGTTLQILLGALLMLSGLMLLVMTRKQAVRS
jgi:Ca-activated chloride channel family protein